MGILADPTTGPRENKTSLMASSGIPTKSPKKIGAACSKGEKATFGTPRYAPTLRFLSNSTLCRALFLCVSSRLCVATRTIRSTEIRSPPVAFEVSGAKPDTTRTFASTSGLRIFRACSSALL